MNTQYPKTNTALEDEKLPIVTEGAKFIVEEAMKDDPRPLYIGMQGAITDLTCAILMEPRICERMTCIWIGGGDGYEMIEAPLISEQDMTYSFGTGNRAIRVYHKMDVRLDLEDLFARLQINLGLERINRDKFKKETG